MEEQNKPKEPSTTPAKVDDRTLTDSEELTLKVYAALKRLKKEAVVAEMSETDAASVGKQLRDEYALHIDLYKHYMTVAASFNVLYYGVTGAVVSYALGGERWRVAALLLPLVISVFYAFVFLKAWSLFRKTEKGIQTIAETLGFKCKEVSVLTRILLLSWLMFCGNSLGLLALFILKLCNALPG